MKQDERWFVSYRVETSGSLDFLLPELQKVKYFSVVINTTPAQWVRVHGVSYHILYAEKISPALASELVHGGAGIPSEYFDNEA